MSRLEGLKWITNDFENDPKKEIEILKEIKDYIVNDNENKILITHYSFFLLFQIKNFSHQAKHIHLMVQVFL